MFILDYKLKTIYMNSENSFVTDWYCFYLNGKKIRAEKGSIKHIKDDFGDIIV